MRYVGLTVTTLLYEIR